MFYMIILSHGPSGPVLTFFAVFALVSGVTHTRPHDADAVATAVDVDALVVGDVTLGAFPAAVAQTAPPGVLTVPAAQHRAGSWTRGSKGRVMLAHQSYIANIANMKRRSIATKLFSEIVS